MTTNESAGFFQEIAYTDTEVPEVVPRDQWKRPLILAPDGSGELVAYTRASTMSGYISDTHGLTTWQKRLIAQGMGHREDLAAMAAALPPYDQMQGKHKAELQEIVDAALETARAYEKANWGTAVHAFTDPLQTSGPVPEAMRADVDSHAEAMEKTGIVRFASEVFVVNDLLKVAGTLDMIVGVPALGRLLVGDTKTGKQDLHKTAIQVSIYADAKVYDPETGERTPLHDHVTALHPELAPLPPLDDRNGLYVHIPRAEGRTTLHPLNLERGRYMAQLCASVREWRSSQDFVAPDVTDQLAQRRNLAAMKEATEATSVEALKDIFARYRWCMNDKLERTFRARFDELTKGA